MTSSCVFQSIVLAEGRKSMEPLWGLVRFYHGRECWDKRSWGYYRPTLGPFRPALLCFAFCSKLKGRNFCPSLKLLFLFRWCCFLWGVVFLWGCGEYGSSKGQTLPKGRKAWWWPPQTSGQTSAKLGLSLIPGPHSVPRALPKSCMN